MDTLKAPPEVKKILGGSGKKLQAHEVHIRRTAEKGKFIAKHILRDKHGNAPEDGQRAELEYPLSSPEEMLSHVQTHMGSLATDDEEEG